MNASFSSRMALGVGFALLAGLSLTVVPTNSLANTHPVSSSTAAPLGPVNQLPTANGPQCTWKASLIALPNATHVNQPVQFLTLFAPIKTTSNAVCPTVYGFHWVSLPIGCSSHNAPVLFCVPQLPGVYHTTVTVYVSTAAITASTVVTVS